MRSKSHLAIVFLCLTACDGALSSPSTGDPWSDAGVADELTVSQALTGAPWCDTGGQIANSHGVEAPFGTAVVGLVRRALGCDSSWTVAPPPASYREHGTPNHKLLWRVWYYGWAQLEGSPAQVEDARDLLLSFFDAQARFGQYAISDGANEVLTTSHYEIWVNGMAAARLLAVVYDDRPLLQATGRWWRGEKALYDVLSRGGSIDAPGARFKPGQAGPSPLRNTIYAMLSGRRLPGRAGQPRSVWWNDYYNVGAWTLRELLRMGDDLGGTRRASQRDLPRLHDPLIVESRGNDYVFSFPRIGGALEPIFWVARIDGVVTRSPYVSGTPITSAVPPPALPGASVFTIPGVR